MDKPKVDNPMVMAQALIRALLLNTDSKTNSVHTDCGAWLWEDGYNIDVEKLRGYHEKTSQNVKCNSGDKKSLTFHKYCQDRMKRDYEHKILQDNRPQCKEQDNNPTSRDTLQPKKTIKWIRKKDVPGHDKASA